MPTTISSRSRPSLSVAPRSSLQLPIYEAPAAPLNATAIRAIQTLKQTHDTSKLKKHLADAGDYAANAAMEANDTLRITQTRQAKRRDRAEESFEDEGSDSTAIEEMRTRVVALTSDLEKAVREVIDIRASVEAKENALVDIGNTLERGEGRVDTAPTQSTLGASQARSMQRRRTADDSDEEDNSLNDGEDSGAPYAGGGEGALNVLKRKTAEYTHEYSSLSMSERYASHNTYKNYKRLVHDAMYPGADAPPVPHESTWFRDMDGPSSFSSQQAGKTSHEKSRIADNAAPMEDSDSDIEAVSERISIKCPLTLRPMEDPVTSRKCPHSFEKEAIVSMINNGSLRVGGSGRNGTVGGQKAVKCPVCSIILTKDDLASDPVLLRKIARLREAEAAANDDFDEDGERDIMPDGSQRFRAQTIGSEDGDNAERDDMRTRQLRVKMERMSGVPPNSSSRNG